MDRIYDNPDYGWLVTGLVRQFAGRDNVRSVGHQGLELPDKIGRFRPDVTAIADSRPLIGLAISTSRLDAPEEVERLRTCVEARAEQDPPAVIWLAVEKGERDRARELFRAAGVDPDDDLNDVLTVDLSALTRR